MHEEVIMAGFGGQGVMSMGQILAYSGMLEGKEVSWLPSYGPEMRGGTANCNVIVSDTSVASPVITDATAAIIMNRPSLNRFQDLIMAGGSIFINTSLVDEKCNRDDLQAYYIPANEIADELGNNRIANMILLGAYIEHTGIVSAKSVLNSLKEVLGESKVHLLPINEEALKRGASFVK
ncbi:MAG: 2-oxoacid:ferredoxin oxidoreductase subunit gamma [Clostridiales bacterium]|nr:2-oxoacid:ferredoxin oxidoreductase subunit gamma [Clostridiales bacterium]